MKKMLTLALAAVLCLSLAACGCKHEWKDADCENPKTCELCGETEGEALGHQESDWEETEVDTVKAVKHLEKTCTRCDKVMDEKDEPMDTLIADGKFLLTTEDFEKRMDNMLNEQLQDKDMVLTTSSEEEFGIFTYYVEYEGEMVGMIARLDEFPSVAEGQPGFGETWGAMFNKEDAEIGEMIFTAMIETLDPQMDDAKSAALLDHIVNGSDIVNDNNGISYVMGIEDGGVVELVAGLK